MKNCIPNDEDNCPNIPNQDKEDTDEKDIGNKCEPSILEQRYCKNQDYSEGFEWYHCLQKYSKSSKF